MYAEYENSKFTKHLGKFISTQWSKIKSSSNSSESDKNIDQQLEEEYEVLLREIDYLTAEKSCYLSFLNDNFHKAKSSEDLSAILKRHSSEVLKNYLKNHDKEGINEKSNNRQDLVNYVTEVVISRNTFNNKICSCKPIKVSKEVLTECNICQENRKQTQTSRTTDYAAEKATSAQNANHTKTDREVKKVTATVQTDDWSHDPFCKCGCCPKTETDNKSMTTEEKTKQDSTTSDRNITDLKIISDIATYDRKITDSKTVQDVATKKISDSKVVPPNTDTNDRNISESKMLPGAVDRNISESKVVQDAATKDKNITDSKAVHDAAIRKISDLKMVPDAATNGKKISESKMVQDAATNDRKISESKMVQDTATDDMNIKDSKTVHDPTTGKISDSKTVSDAATNNRKIAESKDALANCTSTSKRLCVPDNFEKLLENDKTNRFAMCTETKDCACDAYDIKQAIRRGLVLPSSDICIQKKIVQMVDEGKTEKNKSLKQSKNYESSSDDYDTSNTTSSDDKKKQAKKEKENGKKKKDSRTNSGVTKEKPKKKKGTTGCFGTRKKKSGCDEYCLGINGDDKSIQTRRIKTYDKNEEACFCNKKNQRAEQTSTESEATTQVSARPSIQDRKQDKVTWTRTRAMQDKETGPRPDSTQDRETSPRRDIKPDRGTLLIKGNQETGSRPDSTQSGETSPRTDIIPDRGTLSIEGNKKDIDFKENRGSPTEENHNKDRDNRDKDNSEKLKNSVCSRCGRLKRDCNTCRNRIIIPYASGSNKILPAGDAESLRMLIKMQSRDTNRQFDNIMSELNYQKSEVRRLNDIYQKMMENFYDMQKSASSSQSQNKKSSDLSRDCLCSNLFTSKRSDNAKQSGCSNECKTIKKQDTPTGRSYASTVGNNSNTNNLQLRRFGPPNTAVAINRCDVGNVEVAGSSGRARFSPSERVYDDGDKQKKDQLNQSRKVNNSQQNLSEKNRNIPSGGTGDGALLKADSISTLYKKETYRRDGQMDKINAHEKIVDGKADFIKESEGPDSTKKTNVIKLETESSEPRKKTSSRILIWFKKSWIGINHRRESDRKRGEKQTLLSMFKFCQSKAKQGATGMWRAAKNVTKGH